MQPKHHITQHIRFGLTALALRDIAPFGRNVVYAGDVIRSLRALEKEMKKKTVPF